jgi:hypothetical protein
VVKSRHLNAGQNYNIKMAIKLFEDVAKYKYLGMTNSDQNCMYEGIKIALNSKNSRYHSIKNLRHYI